MPTTSACENFAYNEVTHPLLETELLEPPRGSNHPHQIKHTPSPIRPILALGSISSFPPFLRTLILFLFLAPAAMIYPGCEDSPELFRALC